MSLFCSVLKLPYFGISTSKVHTGPRGFWSIKLLTSYPIIFKKIQIQL